MTDHEMRILALEKARKELDDAFLVMTHLEAKQSSVIQLQAQAIDHLRQRDEAQRKLNEDTDLRIANLVPAIGHFISGRNQ